MITLENLLFILFIYNSYDNAYFFTYLASYFASGVIVYNVAYKFSPDKQVAYCNFADKRFICGIPYFGDVVSNGVFFLAGGMQWLCNNNPVFGVICILIGVGSTYFHLRPCVETLYWDRLSMVIGMAYLIMIKSGLSFQELLISGVYTLDYNSNTKDLLPYAMYQLNMILFWILISGITSPVILYIMAKVCEDYDKEIYLKTNCWISGHTIKHVLAGFAMMAI